MGSPKVIIVKDSKTVNQFLAFQSYNAIAVDLEGHNLSRNGDIYTVKVFMSSLQIAYIFDCRKLKKSDVVNVLKKFSQALISRNTCLIVVVMLMLYTTNTDLYWKM